MVCVLQLEKRRKNFAEISYQNLETYDGHYQKYSECVTLPLLPSSGHKTDTYSTGYIISGYLRIWD
jgi:hypothetical protein